MTYVFFCLNELTNKINMPVYVIAFFFCNSANNETMHTLDLSWNHIRGFSAVGICKGVQVGFHCHSYIRTCTPKVHNAINVGEFLSIIQTCKGKQLYKTFTLFLQC